MIPESQSAPAPSPLRDPYGAGSVLPPLSRALLFLIIGFLLWVYLPRAVPRLAPNLTGSARLAYAYVLLDAAVLVESWLLLRALDRRSFRTIGLCFYPGWWKELARGMGLGAVLIGLVVAILFLLGAVRYAGLSEAPGALVPAFEAEAGVLFLAAAFEELAFRGYGFQRLVDAFGSLGAVVVFSGLFGVVHLLNPGATGLSTVSTALSGVLLSVAYLKTRALWLPIGLHWAWNFCLGPIFSLPVSGIDFGPTLLHAQLRGATWLTGGNYGPEGGVVVIAVVLAGIVFLVRTRRLTTSPAMEEVLK